jgi:iron complex outermembrane receptor protein
MKKTLTQSVTALVSNALLFLYLTFTATSVFALDEKSETSINGVTPSAVLIYASRFEEPVENSLPQTFIITDREIQKSGLSNVSEVLQKIGGLTVRQNLDGSTNGVIDIRGFGDAADNNVLVLLDGVRLSENEQASARTSLIPLEAIDHIEIMRGGNSVLYGDGATGGTINIVTKSNLNDLTVVSAGLGSYSTIQSSVFHARKNNDISLTFFGRQLDGSSYRENSGARERSAGFSAINHLSASDSVGIRATVSNERDKLPGALPISYMNKTPTASQVAGYSSTARVNTSSITLFGVNNLRSDIQFRVDFNHSTKSSASNYQYNASTIYDGYDPTITPGQSPYSKGYSNYASHTNSFNPRLKVDNFVAKGGNLIVGYDWREYKRSVSSYKTDSDSSYYNFAGTATNIDDGSNGSNLFRSSGIYLRTLLPANERDSFIFGLRRQNYSYSSNSYYYNAGNTSSCDAGYCDSSTSLFSGSGIKSAYEFQYNKIITKNSKLYFRDSQNFRFANLDDNAGAAFSYKNNLKPQSSHDDEIGFVYEDAKFKSSTNYYNSRLTNEIGFDGSSNVNFDPTKRSGIETLNRYSFSPRISLLGSLNISESRFISGAYSGKNVPGTSSLVGSVGAQYQLNSQEKINWQTRFSSYAYASSDLSNTQTHRSGYGVSDFNYTYAEKQWQLIGSINNVFNKNYADTEIYKSSYKQLYQLTVYPALGRNFSVTGRYNF